MFDHSAIRRSILSRSKMSMHGITSDEETIAIQKERFIRSIKDINNNNEVISLLEAIDPQDYEDSVGQSFLHYAVKAKNRDVAAYLIGRGWEVNALDKDKNTPLMLAVKRCDEQMVKLLIESGADIFICNKYKQDPFRAGVGFETRRHLGMVNILIEELKRKYSNDIQEMAKVFLRIKDPFPRTMLVKDVNLTKYMLTKHCSVNDKDEYGITALHYAVECMDLNNVKLLLELGADVHATDSGMLNTPIHLYKFGSEENHEVLRCLLKHGASLTKTNRFGISVARNTFRKEKKEHIKVLLDHGIDPFDSHGGETFFETMIYSDYDDVIELLENINFDVNMLDGDGQSLLCAAADVSHHKFMKLLLKKGANLNILDKEEKSILFFGFQAWVDQEDCVLDDSLGCFELLLKHGAYELLSVNERNEIFREKSNFKLVRPAIGHVALMVALNQSVEESIIAKIQSHEQFMRYYNICLRKLGKIKNTIFTHSVSLSVFFTEPEEKLLVYTRNPEVVARLEKMIRGKRRSNLYFVKLLRERIWNIVQLAKLREQAISKLSKISECRNDYLLDMIVTFLDKQSMYNLCEA